MTDSPTVARMSAHDPLTNGACADAARHTPEPTGYVSWHEWAEKKAKTHDQVQCPTCGLWTIWKRRTP